MVRESVIGPDTGWGSINAGNITDRRLDTGRAIELNAVGGSIIPGSVNSLNAICRSSIPGNMTDRHAGNIISRNAINRRTTIGSANSRDAVGMSSI